MQQSSATMYQTMQENQLNHTIQTAKEEDLRQKLQISETSNSRTLTGRLCGSVSWCDAYPESEFRFPTMLNTIFKWFFAVLALASFAMLLSVLFQNETMIQFDKRHGTWFLVAICVAMVVGYYYAHNATNAFQKVVQDLEITSRDLESTARDLKQHEESLGHVTLQLADTQGKLEHTHGKYQDTHAKYEETRQELKLVVCEFQKTSCKLQQENQALLKALLEEAIEIRSKDAERMEKIVSSLHDVIDNVPNAANALAENITDTLQLREKIKELHETIASLKNAEHSMKSAQKTMDEARQKLNEKIRNASIANDELGRQLSTSHLLDEKFDEAWTRIAKALDLERRTPSLHGKKCHTMFGPDALDLSPGSPDSTHSAV